MFKEANNRFNDVFSAQGKPCCGETPQAVFRMITEILAICGSRGNGLTPIPPTTTANKTQYLTQQ